MFFMVPLYVELRPKWTNDYGICSVTTTTCTAGSKKTKVGGKIRDLGAYRGHYKEAEKHSKKQFYEK